MTTNQKTKKLAQESLVKRIRQTALYEGLNILQKVWMLLKKPFPAHGRKCFPARSSRLPPRSHPLPAHLLKNVRHWWLKSANPKTRRKPRLSKQHRPQQPNRLSDSSTSEEECTDEELVHAPAPQEQTFPQRVNEPLKIDRQQILKIANSRYVPKRLADGTAMLCEVSGAANSMMRRWESVFREYPDILSDAENRASVGRTIQKLRDHLNNLEDKMEELL